MQQQASSHAVDDRPERHVLDLFLLSRGLFVFIILLWLASQRARWLSTPSPRTSVNLHAAHRPSPPSHPNAISVDRRILHHARHRHNRVPQCVLSDFSLCHLAAAVP